MSPVAARALGALLLAGWASGGALAQAHVHGLARLEIGVEPRAISLRLEVPQHDLLGHERSPGSAAERQAAAALLKRLQDGAALFGLPAALGCRLADTQVDAPRLQPGAPASADGHAEVVASYRFDCASTAGLSGLGVGGLFDAFAGLQRLRAQVVDASGQHQATAKRPARSLVWGR